MGKWADKPVASCCYRAEYCHVFQDCLVFVLETLRKRRSLKMDESLLSVSPSSCCSPHFLFTENSFPQLSPICSFNPSHSPLWVSSHLFLSISLLKLSLVSHQQIFAQSPSLPPGQHHFLEPLFLSFLQNLSQITSPHFLSGMPCKFSMHATCAVQPLLSSHAPLPAADTSPFSCPFDCPEMWWMPIPGDT